MGMFDAVLALPSISESDVPGVDEVRKYVDVHEFILAFDLLTAILADQRQPMSDEARAILDLIAGEIGAKAEDWNGLRLAG
jgi:hypothetical protein